MIHRKLMVFTTPSRVRSAQERPTTWTPVIWWYWLDLPWGWTPTHSSPMIQHRLLHGNRYGGPTSKTRSFPEILAGFPQLSIDFGLQWFLQTQWHKYNSAGCDGTIFLQTVHELWISLPHLLSMKDPEISWARLVACGCKFLFKSYRSMSKSYSPAKKSA